jgi:hypothetical protein
MIAGLAKERLMYMTVKAAWSVGLACYGRSFTGFEQSFETAQIFFYDEVWIFAESCHQSATERP